MQVTEQRIEALKAFKAQIEGKNDFEVLEVNTDCDDSAVRAAYFAQIKKYGADFFIGADSDTIADVTVVNKRLREAYDHLQNAEKRKALLESMKQSENSEPDEPKEAQEPLDIAAVFEAEQSLTRAKSLMSRGDYDLALKHLENARNNDPNNFEIKVRYAFAEFMNLELDAGGHRPAAKVAATREILEKAAKEWPNNDEIRIYQGEVEKLEDNIDKALEFYRQAVKMNNSPIAQREVKLIESRQANKAAKEEAPKSFLDQIKATIKKLSEIKL